MELDAFLVAVGANIKQARWLAGLTQEQVSGLTLRYYQDVESGRRNSTLGTLLALAEQFGCTVADLVNVPGAEPDRISLRKRKATAPRAGRKPRNHPRAR